MPSLDKSFKELLFQLKQGRGLSHSGMDPVFYLVFRPEEMLDVKRLLKSWMAKLKHDDWNVHVFSMVDAVNEILREHDLRDIWFASEKDAPFDFDAINKTLSDALMGSDQLKNLFLEKLKDLQAEKNDLLLVTDLEAIHPYLLIGKIEQKLQGKFKVPTVVLYPGIRSGKITLKFLGIYA